MKRWCVGYFRGNTYKYKYVYGKDSAEAIKKAKIKNIKELFIVDECGNRIG